MTIAPKSMLILAVLGLLFFLAAPASADWKPGDGYKMHFPQLPDPDGWDVSLMQPGIIADDWMCTGSGPVSDIHGWISVRGDADLIAESMILGIYSDAPIDQGAGFSRPDKLLWSRTISAANLVVAGPFFGDEGWYDPLENFYQRPDHTVYYQINITGIEQPFRQIENTIYWLGVSVTQFAGVNSQVGWKTSLDHWNDDAVFLGSDGLWHELIDPETGISLDMAFVITPEPGALVLLATAALGLLLFAWRRRK